MLRESSCFSCASCEFGNFSDCRRTSEVGPIEKVQMRRISTSASTIPSATRSHAREEQEEQEEREERQRHECAELAETGSIIAITRGQRQELGFILVTMPLGQLDDPGMLKGRILRQTDTPNQFTSASARLLSFHAELVRSPPLKFTSLMNEKSETVYSIEGEELHSLTAEFAFCFHLQLDAEWFSLINCNNLFVNCAHAARDD